ncbi:adenine nucleotide alpha hydrolase [Vibrio sp. HDW18]|uniref:adenine nucleotide alpha hydrolase n=1 Tax=Vibrio sp. HDW18 TaxID=2714948 RepID=UPI00140A2619|nr:adenine nucleotide alpha hydrolase [Vibrio sp. HDW18]QIL85577.1 adenine nucleotide alpha hydrolase [Vibrio sp. HDW18]
MNKKKVIISWSSGKDSTLTLERLRERPDIEVVGLVTTYVGDEVPFQATPLEVLELQAQLVGLPLIKIELPSIFPSNLVYQSSVVDGLKNSGLTFDALAFGDLFCNGIAEYRQSYLEPAGWQCLFPLMGECSKQLAQEIITRGIQTLVVTTDDEQLSADYCGLWYNAEFLQALPQGIDPCGENGEFHTLVTQAPCMAGRLDLRLAGQDQTERFCYQRYRAQIA